jgi:phosphate uptake regulator
VRFSEYEGTSFSPYIKVSKFHQKSDIYGVFPLRRIDEDQIQRTIDSDDDLDRLNLYIVRQLKYAIEHNRFKEMEFRSPKEFLGYRIVAKNLENIGDNAVGTAKNISSLKN